MNEEDLKRTPVRVSRINLSGLSITNEKFVRNQLKQILDSHNFHQLLKNTSVAKDNLLSFGIFTNIVSTIDSGDDPNKRDGYIVNFQFDESKQITGSCSFTTDSELSANCGANFTYKNAFGKAENFTISENFNSDKAVQNKFVLSKPSEETVNLKYLLSLSKSRLDAYWSQYKLDSRIISPEIQYKTTSGLHQFMYEYNWRHLSANGHTTSMAVREECGNQLKSTLRYILTLDKKAQMLYPDSGYSFKFKSDFSFLTPGDVSALTGDSSLDPSDDKGVLARIKGKFSQSFRLTDHFTGEVNTYFGLIHSLFGHRVPLADRFFLGGPLNFRGFDTCGVGPMAPKLQPFCSNLTKNFQESKLVNTPIGDCGYWVTSLHLYSRLPYFSASPTSIASLFRIQAFLTAGSTFDENLLKNLSKEKLNEIVTSSRLSTGVGLTLKFAGTVRIELNYCFPINHQLRDFVHPGLQFGFGFIYN